MADGQWGNCKGCRHFASHNAQPSEDETSRCMQPDLSEFELEVSGNSGCNAYEARAGMGTPATYHEPAPSVH
ncbi:hypothetical protein [Pyxidicoccus xibeiensis]|uniref:hypothetical protein n=1 Tax=Pyxidicoccus xibeiensis TaxID=2906759 RepID=UPI0020A78A5E|nr:hypothetical protein [Pyxidicoccus xibeiensis]MCP3139228.1 hypothetical protein [Pyxidicoccus xibeiensis]